MSKKKAKNKSVSQLVANEGRERSLPRVDAFTAYAMDRMLYRLGRSPHHKEFFLKGGLLVANMVSAPHRFRRDIDVARRHGPCDEDELKRMFKDIVAVESDDGVVFDPKRIKTEIAEHDVDGYDGIRLYVRGKVAGTVIEVKVDVGFGDVVVPPAKRASLAPFLPSMQGARVFAYPPEPVVAEKVEALLGKFPVIAHRLKDLLDVVMLASERDFQGPLLLRSMNATFQRRETDPDEIVLDEMRTELRGKRWLTDWATMRKEKRVNRSPELLEAMQQFDTFVRPLLMAMNLDGSSPGTWLAGGPWSEHP